MSLQLDESVFRCFEQNLFRWFTPDGPVASAYRDAFANPVTTGLCYIGDRSALKDAPLNDWTALQSWCGGLHQYLFFRLVPEELFYDEIEKQQAPIDYFNTAQKFSVLCLDCLPDLCAPVWGAEIMYDDEVLHLAMEDSEHYALGYDPPIYVARTCDDLTAERGFLPQK